MPKVLTTIQGTPLEAGAQVWEKLVLPCLAATAGRPPLEVQQFYAGLLTAAMGSMAADFGHQRAVFIVSTLLQSFEGMANALPGSLTQ